MVTNLLPFPLLFQDSSSLLVLSLRFEFDEGSRPTGKWQKIQNELYHDMYMYLNSGSFCV